MSRQSLGARLGEVRAAAARALPLTFTVYVVEALLTTAASLPVLRESAQELALSPWDASARALVLDRLWELAAVLRGGALEAAILLGVLGLLGPWLQMSWLSALRAPRDLSRALAEGARRTPRALGVSALVLALCLVLAAPSALLAWLAHRKLEASLSARSHDLALAAALAPAALVALLAPTFHDLARAAALAQRPLRSVRSALRLVLSARVLLPAALAFLLGHAFVLVAQRAAAALSGEVGWALGTAALQSALLARLWLRSLWLAHALACVPAGGAPGAPP